MNNKLKTHQYTKFGAASLCAVSFGVDRRNERIQQAKKNSVINLQFIIAIIYNLIIMLHGF
jgi:hypothetical protein